MNALLTLDGNAWWHIVGWTMLHFLWLGTAVGFAGAITRYTLRRASADVRYLSAIGWLVLLAVMPVAVFGWLSAKPQASDMPPHSNDVVATVADEIDSLERQAINSTVTVDGVDTKSVESPRGDAIASNDVAQSTPISAITGRLTLAVFALESSVAYLPWLWLVGTPLTFALLGTGVVGAERLRLASRIINDGPIADVCAQLCQAMRVGRRVSVAICERIAAPVLVGIVRPVILLPPAALTGWSPDEIEMVLLHELAHVRRWDNFVNFVQRIVESLLFFHPAVWLVSHWVRREREACCDAVVVDRTQRPHAYAEMLVALAASLSEPGRPRPRSFTLRGRGRPGSLVSSAMAAGPLRGRIRCILGIDDDPMLVSGKSLAVVISGLLLAATLVVLNLPTRGHAEESTTESTAEGDRSDTLKTEQLQLDTSDGRMTITADKGKVVLTAENTEGTEEKAAEVQFVVGASRFADGDSVTITKVRGTSNTFEPGGTYWIEGTYRLASRERASLSAFVTARKAGEGRTSIDKDQTMIVKRGSGEFTLKLPMPYDGWPHVSFYPAEGGTGFGGVYFGTGDSVLENWSEVYGPDDARSAKSHAKVDLGKFPSLEEQKLADLAYRMLHLELEPIGEDDLKRVQALGYDGGVRVANQPHSMSPAHELVFADIVVGLHVWPTTSLNDIADVLSRDDLAELNPLKFYVLRAENEPVTGTTGTDQVVTGRIAVNLEGRPQRAISAAIGEPTGVLVPAAATRTLTETEQRLMLQEVQEVQRQLADTESQLAALEKEYRIREKILRQRATALVQALQRQGAHGRQPQAIQPDAEDE